MDFLNKVIAGDALEELRKLPSEYFHCCVTSPPYWGLRDYGTGKWEGGDEKCDHKGAPLCSSSSSLAGYTSENIKLRTFSVPMKEVCSKCGASRIDKQIGLEKTPEEYVAKLVEVFREVYRVLRKDGIFFLNIGDSYNGSGKAGTNPEYQARHTEFGKPSVHTERFGMPTKVKSLKPKDLVGIPWRVAFALQADGWYLRSDIIWSKPNPMPESVGGTAWERHTVKSCTKEAKEYEKWVKEKTSREGKGRSSAINSSIYNKRPELMVDCPGCPKCSPNDGYILSWNAGRPTKSHEYIFMFSKSDKYFFDQEAVREEAVKGYAGSNFNTGKTAVHQLGRSSNSPREESTGRNIRSVWTIPTQPFSEAHFATFPQELVERCIKAGTSEKGACPKCGSPWVRVIEKGILINDYGNLQPNISGKDYIDQPIPSMSSGLTKSGFIPGHHREVKTTGWKPSCKCDAGDPVHCVVLDPFIGSGTSGLVARHLNRDYVGIDLNGEQYVPMARKRIPGKVIKDFL